MQRALTSDKAMYQQLAELLTMQILNGTLKAGEKVKTIAQLAIEAEVNINTMHRALVEVERQGLLCSERTKGRHVTRDIDLILQMRECIATEQTNKCLSCMRYLGYTIHETIAMIENGRSDNDRKIDETA